MTAENTADGLQLSLQSDPFSVLFRDSRKKEAWQKNLVSKR